MVGLGIFAAWEGFKMFRSKKFQSSPLPGAVVAAVGVLVCDKLGWFSFRCAAPNALFRVPVFIRTLQFYKTCYSNAFYF
jgi:hypothetical protein